MFKLRDAILQDPTALEKWPMIVDHIVERADDRRRVKKVFSVEREYGEAVLESLNIWKSYGDERADLINVLTDYKLKALADKILEEALLPVTDTGAPTRMTAAAPAATGIWFEVGEVVYNFTGRETELTDLHHMLTSSQSTESVAANIISICGLGGIGKSSLAKKYSFKYRREYDENVIWINAETVGSMLASFVGLAKRLHLSIAGTESNEDVAASVYEWFSDKKSLFIFDNVEEKSHFKQFQPKIISPSSQTPHILVTTRRNDVAPIPRNQLRLDVLRPDEAINLVCDQLPHANESYAVQLAEKLQRLPLALQQALAYIKDKYTSDGECISKYLKEFQTCHKELLNDERFREDNDYSFTTYATWSVTLARIKTMDGGDAAIRIIEVLAYLNPDLITVQFVTVKFDKQFRTELGLKLLERFSMISLHDGRIRIHRLVQHVIRLSLSPNNERGILKSIIRHLNWKLEKEEFTDETRECTSHGVHLFPFQVKHNDLLKGKDKYLSVLCYFLLYYGNYSDCLTIAEQSASLYENMPGEKYASLRMKWRIGEAHFHMKDHAAAMEILEPILLISKSLRQENWHSLTRHVQHLMAEIHSAMGDHQKAITIYDEFFPAEVRLFGQHPHNALKAQQDKANALRRLGRLDEASELLLAVYTKRLELYGENDLRVLGVKGDMGDLALSKGEVTEALKIWTEVHDSYKRIAGEEHPEVIDTKRKIAEAEAELARLQIQNKDGDLNVVSSK